MILTHVLPPAAPAPAVVPLPKGVKAPTDETEEGGEAPDKNAKEKWMDLGTQPQ